LLSRGIYLASIRTIHRVLAALGETNERRAQRLPQVHVKPSLTATAPNQVWTWDITKLATTSVGVLLHAYVIIDLFSRYVVEWMVAAKESKHLAAQLFGETIARHGVEPGLTVHSDRGSAMMSSFSRPRVSDDNAFSEAQFTRLPWAVHRRAARPRLAPAVLRVAQRRAPLGPRAFHPGRGLLQSGRAGAHRPTGWGWTPPTPSTQSASRAESSVFFVSPVTSTRAP
jgi:transposase InsO family protein